MGEMPTVITLRRKYLEMRGPGMPNDRSLSITGLLHYEAQSCRFFADITCVISPMTEIAAPAAITAIKDAAMKMFT